MTRRKVFFFLSTRDAHAARRMFGTSVMHPSILRVSACLLSVPA